MAVNMHLSKFKEMGVVQFRKLFEISTADRIPYLAKNEETKFELLIALTASLKSAFNNMNLRVGMNEDQTIELADQIINQAHEDNLALEDVLLFLQKLLTAEYGKIYDRMDIPTFFEFFEKYRSDRYQSLRDVRDEEQAQFRAITGGHEAGKESMNLKEGEDAKTMLDLMQTFYGNDNVE